QLPNTMFKSTLQPLRQVPTLLRKPYISMFIQISILKSPCSRSLLESLDTTLTRPIARRHLHTTPRRLNTTAPAPTIPQSQKTYTVAEYEELEESKHYWVASA